MLCRWSAGITTTALIAVTTSALMANDHDDDNILTLKSQKKIGQQTKDYLKSLICFSRSKTDHTLSKRCAFVFFIISLKQNDLVYNQFKSMENRKVLFLIKH